MAQATNHDAGAEQQSGSAGDAAGVLPAVMGLTQAVALRDSLAVQLNRPAVILNAAAIERMSTPCVQLLLSAGRQADSAGRSFQIVEASAVFRTAVADLGLQSEFAKWMA
ncbi:MAG TPA: STAS domain-containing protein [Rhodopseudomonas sp.]|uniref:STAS domain-containing protein n=1 Tax=Rhodopseudomonas sp. TaxID=1078 RepID=UPI002ED8983E